MEEADLPELGRRFRVALDQKEQGTAEECFEAVKVLLRKANEEAEAAKSKLQRRNKRVDGLEKEKSTLTSALTAEKEEHTRTKRKLRNLKSGKPALSSNGPDSSPAHPSNSCTVADANEHSIELRKQFYRRDSQI